MNAPRPIGLGNLDMAGKRSLFLPPKPEPKPVSIPTQAKNNPSRPAPKSTKQEVIRIRTTTELTPRALTILQKIQQQHRLQTGKVLPQWKAISQAIEHYGLMKKIMGLASGLQGRKYTVLEIKAVE